MGPVAPSTPDPANCILTYDLAFGVSEPLRADSLDNPLFALRRDSVLDLPQNLNYRPIQHRSVPFCNNELVSIRRSVIFRKSKP
ncbi:unnamed protein product [Clavelina lepadiformis]|uniref:Uncharacterized protein n=1 Tax=Clavelina lepadiformis TaxID=159417 RepID=A0ABP0FS61_CLALP